MTASAPRTRRPLSPWARWALLLMLPVGVGLPTLTYLAAILGGAQ